MKQDEFIKKWLGHVKRPNYPQKTIDLMNKDFNDMVNHLLSKKPSVSDEEIRKYANGNFGFDSDSTNLEHAFCSGAEWMRDKLPPQVVQSEVSEEHLKQLRDEIEHIFDSGANELRVYEMVKTFIERRYLSLTPPDAEAVMFAEWIYKNYISNGIGKYYHNNWNGDLDTLVNYTTQELFTLYKQGGK